ncbi:MAG TPA: class I SAM-dependent methyltransferase, partial [Rhodopila sp.]
MLSTVLEAERSLMQFEQVLSLLRSYRSPAGDAVLFLLAEQTMESIYHCVLDSGASACLELGTGLGATTCVIAAALDERRDGRVTTVDMLVREPIGVQVLAQHTGLAQYIDVVADPVGYTWYLKEIIERQTSRNTCEPCFDFCFLDGAHEWAPDALATFLVAKLLRPGSWLVLDDLDFKLRGCQPGWRTVFASRTDAELDAFQVDRVFNLVLRQHPDFADFAVSDGGRTGWARKKSSNPAAWFPMGLVLDPIAPDWQESFQAENIVGESRFSDSLAVTSEDTVVALRAIRDDPNFALPPGVDKGRPIDVISLRLRLVAPDAETLQLFWINRLGDPFNERQSVRARIAASDDFQDVTIRINGSGELRPVHAIRVDPTDGPGSLLLQSVSV